MFVTENKLTIGMLSFHRDLSALPAFQINVSLPFCSESAVSLCS